MGAPTTVDLPAAGSDTANGHLTDMLHALQDALRAEPAWGTAVASALDRAFAAYDAYLAHVVAAHPMACASGCTACCHDDPRGVTGVELRRLADAVDGLPDGDAVYAAFAASGAGAVDAGVWRARRVPCPLLSAAGRCRAYAARPVACRAFHALTPAAWCGPEHPRHAERVNPHLDPPAVLLQALRVLSARLGLPAPTDLHGGMARLFPR